MRDILVTRSGGQVIWHDARILPQVSPRTFDPAWQQGAGAGRGSAPGRGQALFLHIGGHDLVLRPFRRGGLIGRVNPDLYLRFGAGGSRAFREYRLLQWMRRKGLPVPRPVAARYAPSGPFYRADLITGRIADARTLADVLACGALTPAQWSDIGATIRRMHGLGVDHSDLNCRNILLDAAMQVWLIDFDKCRRRRPGPWTGANLARLHRSLAREKAKVPGLSWSGADWAALLTGYGGAPPGPDAPA